MPVPVPEALADAATLAEAKAKAVKSLPRYLAQSALAGAYVGVAVVLLMSVAGPLAAAVSSAAMRPTTSPSSPLARSAPRKSW